MKRVILIFVAAFLSGIWFSSSYAGHHGTGARKSGYHGYGHYGYDHHGNLFLDYAEELGLSSDQVEKLNKLRVEKKKKMRELKDEMSKLRRKMNKLAHEEKPNRKKIKKLAMKLGNLKGEKTELRVMSILDAKEVLTEDQRKKLRAKFEKVHGEKAYCEKCKGKCTGECKRKAPKATKK